MPSSHPHRHRVVNRLRKIVASNAAAVATSSTEDDDGEPVIPPPAPGQMRLYSYYAPGLKAGLHTITVNHLVHAPHGSVDKDPKHALKLHSTQDFEVYGLRFSLPAGVVHQTYPPQGHADHNVVLPHIVFTDAHLPWEQVGSPSEASPSSTGAEKPRNSVPWLALLVFTEDELNLTQKELLAIAGSSGKAAGLVQSKTTMSLKMALGDVLQLKSVNSVYSPVKDDDPADPIDGQQVVDMIFLRGDLFTSLFCSYDQQWNRILPSNGKPDLSRYKYLAHVRNINTPNMAGAGVEDLGLYSIIVSHRCGPNPGFKRQLQTPRTGPAQSSTVNIDLPKSMIVHLISLQGVESNLSLPFTDPMKTRVGLVSLYSWTYTCLPPDLVNFVDSMRTIGRQVPQPLRPPTEYINRLKLSSRSDPTKQGPLESAQRMRDRLLDGYSLLRYLPRTGEKTVAFSRGPLTPTLPAHPPTSFWPSQCNFSTSLQILDAHLGIMDITYSTAWELGRTLAIADRAFTAAVVRVRRATNVYGIRAAQQELLGENFRGKEQVIANLPAAIKLMGDIPKQLATGDRVVDPTKRWMSSELAGAPASSPQTLKKSPALRKAFAKHVHNAVRLLSSATGGSTDGEEELLPYNEINIPNNTDWSLVLKWIVDKLYLYNIPAHYLITDPSHLPQESIRFFYIDPSWMDSLIDGALSVGNHLERADDVVRQAMKFNLNKYFATQIDQDHHPYKPQIPTYGFFLRSAVVQAFPNLQVHAPWPPLSTGHPDPREEVLRLELLDKDVLLCLFDRLPGSKQFVPLSDITAPPSGATLPMSGITISQPPHQQSFAVGNRVGPNADNVNEFEFEFRRAYTSTVLPPPPHTWSSLSFRTWREGHGEVVDVDPVTKKPVNVLNPPNPAVVFDWDNDTLIVEAFARTCNNVLFQEMNTTTTTYFSDVPSSTLVGIQLNDPIKKITIDTPKETHRLDPRPRFIHLTADDTQYVPPPPTSSVAAGRAQKKVGLTKGLATTPQPPPSLFPGQFFSSAFVIGHVGDPTLSMETPILPVDLIFAFSPVPQLIPNLNIFQVQVRIPIGSGAQHLFTNYDGPGGKMLSNQRFNVHISTATTNDFVFVSLIPRSTTRLVPLAVNPDISFILNEVTLNGVSGTVNMDVIEDYRNHGEGGDPTKWPKSIGRTTIKVQKRLSKT